MASETTTRATRYLVSDWWKSIYIHYSPKKRTLLDRVNQEVKNNKPQTTYKWYWDTSWAALGHQLAWHLRAAAALAQGRT